VKGNRQSFVVTKNPSTVDAKELLTVRFPNLGKNDVINITLNSSTDADRTVVNNLGRSIVKMISVKLEGQAVMCLDNADIYLCYRDLWMSER